jgi:hypothetical protein
VLIMRHLEASWACTPLLLQRPPSRCRCFGQTREVAVSWVRSNDRWIVWFRVLLRTQASVEGGALCTGDTSACPDNFLGQHGSSQICTQGQLALQACAHVK